MAAYRVQPVYMDVFVMILSTNSEMECALNSGRDEPAEWPIPLAFPLGSEPSIPQRARSDKSPRSLRSAISLDATLPSALAAHVHEEMTTQRPMRRIPLTDHEYIGPEPRTME